MSSIHIQFKIGDTQILIVAEITTSPPLNVSLLNEQWKFIANPDVFTGIENIYYTF